MGKLSLLLLMVLSSSFPPRSLSLHLFPLLSSPIFVFFPIFSADIYSFTLPSTTGPAILRMLILKHIPIIHLHRDYFDVLTSLALLQKTRVTHCLSNSSSLPSSSSNSSSSHFSSEPPCVSEKELPLTIDPRWFSTRLKALKRRRKNVKTILNGVSHPALDLEYENLVANPKEEVCKVLQFLKCDCEAATLLVKNRPIINRPHYESMSIFSSQFVLHFCISSSCFSLVLLVLLLVPILLFFFLLFSRHTLNFVLSFFLLVLLSRLRLCLFRSFPC
jgi:hypothetical protein